jgi:hypothetical protein
VASGLMIEKVRFAAMMVTGSCVGGNWMRGA